jgi:capsular polysaccharide biosynthesis protein
VSASEPLTQILAGDTLRADNNGTSVEVYYNPKTGNIHAKGKTENRVIPVKATNTESGTEKTGIKAENKEVKKDVTVKPYVWGNIVIGLILTAIVAAFFLFIRWRLKVNGIL